MREYEAETVSGEFIEAFDKVREKLTLEEITFLAESNAIEGVDDSSSLLCAMEAWEYIKKPKVLSVKNVLETHKILMQNSNLFPKEKGYFRDHDVRVGNMKIGYRKLLEYKKIPSEIEKWVGRMNLTVNQTYDKESEEQLNKELHVQYENIHPFVDGNGRTGRIFMNWWRLRRGMPILIINELEKQDYYSWFPKGENSLRPTNI